MKQALNSVHLIIGLGKTGLSCAEFLNDRALPFKAIDTREVAPFADQIRDLSHCRHVFCGDPDLHLDVMEHYLEDVAQIIVSPGVAQTGRFFELLKERQLEIIGDIELFAREVIAPVIAITGSNGKSTVTQLTGELLSACGKEVLIGGNIGTPALQLLKKPQPDFYVLELSSFQLETTYSLSPITGTVLNISEDHMDRYESLEDYSNVKLSMLDKCRNVVVNQDVFPNKIYLSTKASGQQMTTSIEINQQNADFYRYQSSEGTIWISSADQPLFIQDELKIPGLHNISNAMTSIALCEVSGVAITDQAIEMLKHWPGLKHRCQYIGKKHGIDCYNDSKATNIGATIAALEGLTETIRGKIILIAGGDGKGSSFTPLAEIFKQSLRALVLIGRDAQRLMQQAGNGLQAVIVDDMKQAVSKAFSFALSGDVILLSPACASLDMYKNFEQRGEIFIREVEAQA